MDEVLSVFRAVAPDLIFISDTDVLTAIEMFKPMVSKKTFGAKYNLALAYFVAHILSLNNMYASNIGTPTDTTPVRREREGDLEREYAIPDASDYMSLLYKTYYGRMYLQIMKLCAIGVKTRFG